MNTDDLIAQLASEPTPPPASAFRHRIATAVALACTCSIAIAWLMGRQLPSWHDWLHDRRLWVTLLVLLIASHSAWSVMLKLARPGIRLGKSPWLLTTAMTALCNMASHRMGQSASATIGSAFARHLDLDFAQHGTHAPRMGRCQRGLGVGRTGCVDLCLVCHTGQQPP